MTDVQKNLQEAAHLNPWTPEQLRSAREYFGLTQLNIAEILGITTTTVCNLEKGIQVNPTNAILYGIVLERYYAWTQFLDPEYVALKVGRHTGGSPEWAYREIMREVKEDGKRLQRSAV